MRSLFDQLGLLGRALTGPIRTDRLVCVGRRPVVLRQFDAQGLSTWGRGLPGSLLQMYKAVNQAQPQRPRTDRDRWVEDTDRHVAEWSHHLDRAVPVLQVNSPISQSALTRRCERPVVAVYRSGGRD